MSTRRLIRIFGSYIAACAIAAFILSLTGVSAVWNQAPSLFHFVVIAGLQLSSLTFAITPFVVLAAALPALLLLGFGEHRRIWHPYYYAGVGIVVGLSVPALIAAWLGKSVSVDSNAIVFAVSGLCGGSLYWRLAIWTLPEPPAQSKGIQ